jgi:hypothetical protein
MNPSEEGKRYSTEPAAGRDPGMRPASSDWAEPQYQATSAPASAEPGWSETDAGPQGMHPGSAPRTRRRSSPSALEPSTIAIRDAPAVKANPVKGCASNPALPARNGVASGAATD